MSLCIGRKQMCCLLAASFEAGDTWLRLCSKGSVCHFSVSMNVPTSFHNKQQNTWFEMVLQNVSVSLI